MNPADREWNRLKEIQEAGGVKEFDGRARSVLERLARAGFITLEVSQIRGYAGLWKDRCVARLVNQ